VVLMGLEGSWESGKVPDFPMLIVGTSSKTATTANNS
jgi:hypothetical protein